MPLLSLKMPVPHTGQNLDMSNKSQSLIEQSSRDHVSYVPQPEENMCNKISRMPRCFVTFKTADTSSSLLGASPKTAAVLRHHFRGHQQKSHYSILAKMANATPTFTMFRGLLLVGIGDPMDVYVLGGTQDSLYSQYTEHSPNT